MKATLRIENTTGIRWSPWQYGAKSPLAYWTNIAIPVPLQASDRDGYEVVE